MFTAADPIIRNIDENAAVGPIDVEPGGRCHVDTDGAGTDTLTYTIVSVTPPSGSARFSINVNNDNEGQLQTEEMLDHEEQASYMLVVKVTDSTGNSATGHRDRQCQRRERCPG